ncbi:MAG: PQQ-binding-like beta-propeller repeat protein [Alphaproteobacteria bacterium]
MRRPFVLLLLATLAACDTGWLGEEEAPPLPGERRAVLTAETRLDPDPALADTPLDLPAPNRNPTWPQRGGDATHHVGHLALAEAPQRRWSADLGAGNGATSRIVSPPVVDDGRVFAADARARVQAFDLASGERLWRRDFELASDRRLGAGVAASGGGVFVATARGEVAALDAASGEVVWSTELAAPVRAAPTLAGRYVVVLTADNQTFALDAVDGTVVWTHQGFAEPSALLGGPSPAATGGLTIVPYSSGEVFGLVLETGESVWLDAVQRPRRTAAVGTIADIQASPVIEPGGRVIVAGHGGEIAAIAADSGDRVWDQRLAAAEMPWVAGGEIFAVSTDGDVVNLDLETGGIRWATQLPRFREPEDPETDRIYHSGPLLAGGRVLVVGSLGDLWSLDPETGEIVDTAEIPRGVTLAPVVADGRLILVDDGGTLHVYE